jgi:hypothetical protein
LNPHAFRRHPLKMVCLPVPPLPLLHNSFVYDALGGFSRGAYGHRDSQCYLVPAHTARQDLTMKSAFAEEMSIAACVCSPLITNADPMPDKPEPRFDADIPIRVFGVDDDDHAFSEIAHARNVSVHGAELCGLHEHLKPGDIIGVHLGDKKSTCQIIWVANAAASSLKINIGIKLVKGQPCPWQTEIEAQRSGGIAPLARAEPKAINRRKFVRHRVPFPIETQDETGESTPMRTQTADVSGRGCYIETMLPFPLGRLLLITFWLNAERIHTPAIVRTCDRGLGMGIEFTGLLEETQKRLQELIESMSAESTEIESQTKMKAEMDVIWCGTK